MNCFLKFLVRPFPSSFFLTKNQPNKLHFFNFFLFHIFSFIIFHFFLSILFSLIIFSFHLFCSSLCAVLSFFSSLLLHSFLFSISVFLFLFFFSTSCFLICFSPSPFFACLHSVLNHSSFLPFDLDLFVFLLLLYPFFFISVSAFLAQTNSKFSVVNFLMTKICPSFFQNHPVI